jgi:hypothetical protein
MAVPQRSAAIQIVRPSSKADVKEKAGEKGDDGKKKGGSMGSGTGEVLGLTVIDTTQRLCRNVLIYGYVG